MLSNFFNQIFSQDGEWFWTMCQFVAVTITLLFILRQIRLQRDSHLVNSFASFDNRWTSQMMLQARRLTCEIFPGEEYQLEQSVAHVGYFFEEIGVYCKRGILDKSVVWEVYSFHIEHYWAMSKTRIAKFRAVRDDVSFYSNFEYLQREMHKISRKKAVPSCEKTDEDIADFILYELGIVEFIERTKEMFLGDKNEPAQPTGVNPAIMSPVETEQKKVIL